MSDSFGHYSRLADLFSYPDAGFAQKVQKVQALLDDGCGEAAENLREFTNFASQASLLELEEVYTRSFDVQAVTTLDIGYVMWGDDYKRGELLVKLNGEHKEAGVDCGNELPDHLPNVLRLLDAMEKPELRDELVQLLVAPALRRIIGEFDSDRVKKKNITYVTQYKTLIDRSERYAEIYEKPLQTLYTLLKRDFDVDSYQEQPAMQESRFLKSIGTEMRLECNKGKCNGATG
ncbi:MAG: nitrate reductase molybdenum cofactor assembly chaperone [Candidatus Krumholzibacteria bacterium]|nr:nitrate reductase molybdenum cofactor assembly chaperone [Candidatus Krumholzibacteria bacterium]